MRCNVSLPDWKAIKAEYDADRMTIDDICLHHKISRERLYRRIGREHWIMRTMRRNTNRRDNAAPIMMIARMRKIIALRISELEETHADQIRAHTALESERQARAIAALVRAVDQLVTIDDRLRERLEKAQTHDDDQTGAWGADLAEALAALTDAKAAAGQPEDLSAGDAAIDEVGTNGATRSAAAD